MKTACIITIGNELITGDSIDTNSAWLAQQFTSFSIPVICTYTVGDDIEIISNTIREAASQADIIILTGGLGPTDDDITRNAAAHFLNEQLVFDQPSWEKIQSYFKHRNYPTPERNKVQAYFPKTAQILSNSLGTAPGFKVAPKDKIIAAFPGVPSEMKKMFEDHLTPILLNLNTTQVIKSHKVHIFGIGESMAAEKLGEMMNRTRNPQINCTVSTGILTLYIIAKAKNPTQADDLIQKDLQTIQKIFKDLIFGYQNQTLPEIVGQLLTEKGKAIALAESCTGGLISKMLTDIPGSSRFFTHGWVTYSNQAKISQLGVSEKTLLDHGAVSPQVAGEMALGAAKTAKSDYSIAVTGIAGPTGSTEQKPVGLVYISVNDGTDLDVHKYNFSRSREFIRLQTAQTALNLLRLKIQV